MADETLDACLILSTTKIKAETDLITKTKKHYFFVVCWCVVCLFLAENLYFKS